MSGDVQQIGTLVTLFLALVASGGAWRSAGRIEKANEAAEARAEKHSEAIRGQDILLARLETLPEQITRAEGRRREDFRALTERMDELHKILSTWEA